MNTTADATGLRPNDLTNIYTPPTSDSGLVDFLAAELRVAYHNLKRRESIVDAGRAADALKIYEEYQVRR